MDSTPRRRRKANPDAYPAPIQPLPGQSVLPCCPDLTDESEAPDTQAIAAPASNGQANGLILPGADTANAEADEEWNLDALRVSQDYAEGLGIEQVTTDV